MYHDFCMKIKCPRWGGSCDNCHWISIPGQVRDAMDCGLIECQECKLVTHSRSLAKQVNYVEGSMHNWSSGYGDNFSKPSLDKLRRFNSITELVEKYNVTQPKILDLGCGKGEMIEVFQESFETSGLEPDNAARELANTRVDESGCLFSSIDEVLSSSHRFDIVTMFHVVEHFYDPDYELQKIRKALKPNGFIVIETPNSQDALLTKYESADFRKFTYWSHHPMLHSHNSLGYLLERNGFSVLENTGVQRYGLANHLHWLSVGKPGGHFALGDLVSTATEISYQRDLVSSHINDTLWLVARL